MLSTSDMHSFIDSDGGSETPARAGWEADNLPLWEGHKIGCGNSFALRKMPKKFVSITRL